MNNSPTPQAPNEYNIATLLDIARIPPDRIPALLSELPRLLDQIRPFTEAQEMFGSDSLRVVAKQLVWVDDGITDGSKDVKTVTFQIVSDQDV